METVLITGNTYPVKDEIKKLGGRWDAEARGWQVPAAEAEAARDLVRGAGSTRRPARRPRYGSTYTRFSSGAEVYTNRRGRCEDAPCCGCCS